MDLWVCLSSKSLLPVPRYMKTKLIYKLQNLHSNDSFQVFVRNFRNIC
jgi:hypothetical protein